MKIIVPFAIIAFILGISVNYFFYSDNNHYENQSGLRSDGNFTLHDGDKQISLSDFKEKIVFIFFGYTSCPDICPTSLAFMGEALKKLSEDELSKVQVLFISVDPERDTTEKLRDYTQYFHPNIMGITGSKKEVDRVVKQYGASYKIVKSNSAMGYLVDHTASFYVLDKKGKLVSLLPHGLPVNAITETIKDLI